MCILHSFTCAYCMHVQHIYIYIHTCMCVYYVSPTDSNYVYYVYIYYAIPTQKNYIAPPQNLPCIYIYTWPWLYMPKGKIPTASTIVLPGHASSRTTSLDKWMFPYLGFVADDIFISLQHIIHKSVYNIYIYIYKKEESIGTTIYLCACFITFWEDHLRGSSS